jgi:hypothetical protein
MRAFKNPVGGGNAKARLILMSVATVAIGGTMIYLLTSVPGADDEAKEQVDERVEEVYALPEILPGTFDDVADADASERRYVEEAQLEIVRTVVRSTTATAIAATGARPLDAATAAEILAAPAAARGSWFTVRGEVLEIALKSTSELSDRDEYVGALRTAEGVTVFFRAQRSDDTGLAAGDWARVDGMFFKVLADEVPAEGGEVLAEGPLLVGPEVLLSFPDFGTVATFDQEYWDAVRDDTLSRTAGPQDAVRWRLLAWMRDLPEGGVRASPSVREGGILREQALVDMKSTPADFRGQVFTLPACRVQGVTVRTAGENPARMEKFTELWLGNALWQKQPLIRVLLPGAGEMFPPGTLVDGELVYFMNVAYDTANGSRMLAPMFVASRLAVFEPPRETAIRAIVYIFTGVLAVMVAVMAVLLRRDQRSSRELAAKLVERRRSRREKVGAAGN